MSSSTAARGWRTMLKLDVIYTVVGVVGLYSADAGTVQRSPVSRANRKFGRGGQVDGKRTLLTCGRSTDRFPMPPQCTAAHASGAGPPLRWNPSMAVHRFRPRLFRAGAELAPRRIISVTVARVFKDCVKDFHEFRQPTTTKGQHGNQSRENDPGFCV